MKFHLTLVITIILCISCNKDEGKPAASVSSGPAGTNGSSCTVQQLANGAKITCTDGTTATVLNGSNGANGTNGQNAAPGDYDIVDIIDPCGDDVGKHDQVILKLRNGDLLTNIKDGNDKNFITVLEPGTYETRDKQECEYTVTVDNDVTW